MSMLMTSFITARATNLNTTCDVYALGFEPDGSIEEQYAPSTVLARPWMTAARRRGSEMVQNQDPGSGQPESGSSGSSDASAVYGLYLQQAQADAITRKTTLEQKGTGIVTTAGTLVTLIFAIVSFVASHTGGSNPHQIIKSLLVAAAALFVTAAALGILISVPVAYGDIRPSFLSKKVLPKDATDILLGEGKQNTVSPDFENWGRLSPFFSETADQANWEIAVARVKILVRARRWNSRKALLVGIALTCEVAAMVCLTVGIHRLL